MGLRLFKPEFSIDDISVSKQIYPDNDKVEETDIFDSYNPCAGDASQDQNDSLDQGIVENEHSDETSVRRIDFRKDRPLNRVPRPLTRTPNS